jgi:hypothetical protein
MISVYSFPETGSSLTTFVKFCIQARSISFVAEDEKGIAVSYECSYRVPNLEHDSCTFFFEIKASANDEQTGQDWSLTKKFCVDWEY